MSSKPGSSSGNQIAGAPVAMNGLRPLICAIIPSLNGIASNLISVLQNQSRPPDIIQLVQDVKPNGKARNQGVWIVQERKLSNADQQEILLFIDDDALPGTPDLVSSLIEPLVKDKTVGVTGAARILPQDASWFQRRVAYEIPRTVNDVPTAPLETNPPLEGYGHSLITTTCCAVRHEVFVAAGGFSEKLISGVDTDFFYRIRRLGYRFIMVPNIFVHHPAPRNLRTLLNKFHWYGIGYGQETRRRPEQKMGPRLSTLVHQVAFLCAATLWVLPNIVFLYSFGYPKFKLGFRPLKALSSYAVAWGYVQGWRRRET